MHTITRRSFVMGVGATALLPAARLCAMTSEQVCHATSTYHFLHPSEARFVEAACDRLIPPDAPKFGALGAGSHGYIDAQLVGPWGRGEQCHRDGPGQRCPSFATPGAVTPAQFFRNTLLAITEQGRHDGTSFVQLAPRDQDRFLSALRGGQYLTGVATREFFDMILQLTVEGFIGTASRGTPCDRIPWQMGGFPAAYARGAK